LLRNQFFSLRSHFLTALQAFRKGFCSVVFLCSGGVGQFAAWRRCGERREHQQQRTSARTFAKPLVRFWLFFFPFLPFFCSLVAYFFVHFCRFRLNFRSKTPYFCRFRKKLSTISIYALSF